MPGLLTPERRQRAKQRSRTKKGSSTKRRTNKSTSTSASASASESVSTSASASASVSASVSTSASYQVSTVATTDVVAQPRTITPTASAESPARSSKSQWRDFDEITAASSASMSMGSPSSFSRGGNRQSSFPAIPRTPSASCDYGSNRSTKNSIREEIMYASDEEMPMDEMMEIRNQQHTLGSPRNSIPSTNALHKHNQGVATYRSVTPTKEVSDVLGLSRLMAVVTPSHCCKDNTDNTDNSLDGGDSVSIDASQDATSGGKPVSSPSNSTSTSNSNSASATGIQQIIAALNSGSTARRPPNLNREECILWDSLQTAMVNDRNGHLSERRALERDLEKSSVLLDEVAIREMELEKEVTQAKTIRTEMEQKYTAMSIVVENHHSRQKNKKESNGENNRGVDGGATGGGNDVSKREVLSLQLQQIDLLKQELQAKDTLMKEQEDSHNTEVMAIQRVLADVTTDKIELEEIMEKQKSEAAGETIQKEDSPNTGISNEELDKLQEKLETSNGETEAARREANEMSEQMDVLKSELKNTRSKLNDVMEKNKNLIAESQATTGEIVDLKSKLEILESNSGKDDPNLDGQLKATIEELKAEVSNQKLETEKTMVEKMEAQVSHGNAMEEAKRLKTENELVGQEIEKLKREREQDATEVEKLKHEKNLAQQDAEKMKKEHQLAANELEELRKVREHAVNEEDKATIEAKSIKAEHPATSPSNSTESKNHSESGEAEAEAGVSLEKFEALQQTLSDTALSLETSKKIIASLENANGSLAVDSRSKLKEKDEELSVVHKESEDRKRNLDSLATELRDLQRKQGDVEIADRRTKVQLIRQKALMDHLDTTLTDLQSAVVVHESSVTILESGLSKNSNIEEISEILGDALHAITATLETSEQFIDDADDLSIDGVDVSSEVGRHIDAALRNDREIAARGLKHELDQKKVAVKRLEEAMKKQNEEMRRMRSQFYNTDNSQFRSEIQRLRQQCSTNMEVLAKKERELSVLRSSLKVDDNESGYISDDASDDEDEDGVTDVGSIMNVASLNAYGPADAEAYATILSQASGRIEMPGSVQMQEIEALKRDLMEALGEKESASKELQARRESLSNAKMIISSLEQANKGMMEDLRSRLHDSNTAISSLLGKSKEHEKTADDLREELKRLEQERREERDNYEADLRKMRTESENQNKGEKVSLEDKEDEGLELASSS